MARFNTLRMEVLKLLDKRGQLKHADIYQHIRRDPVDVMDVLNKLVKSGECRQIGANGPFAINPSGSEEVRAHEAQQRPAPVRQAAPAAVVASPSDSIEDTLALAARVLKLREERAAALVQSGSVVAAKEQQVEEAMRILQGVQDELEEARASRDGVAETYDRQIREVMEQFRVRTGG